MLTPPDPEDGFAGGATAAGSGFTCRLASRFGGILAKGSGSRSSATGATGLSS